MLPISLPGPESHGRNPEISESGVRLAPSIATPGFPGLVLAETGNLGAKLAGSREGAAGGQRRSSPRLRLNLQDDVTLRCHRETFPGYIAGNKTNQPAIKMIRVLGNLVTLKLKKISQIAERLELGTALLTQVAVVEFYEQE